MPMVARTMLSTDGETGRLKHTYIRSAQGKRNQGIDRGGLQLGSTLIAVRSIRSSRLVATRVPKMARSMPVALTKIVSGGQTHERILAPEVINCLGFPWKRSN
jgi:hypothetical protein